MGIPRLLFLFSVSFILYIYILYPSQLYCCCSIWEDTNVDKFKYPCKKFEIQGTFEHMGEKRVSWLEESRKRENPGHYLQIRRDFSHFKKGGWEIAVGANKTKGLELELWGRFDWFGLEGQDHLAISAIQAKKGWGAGEHN